MQKEKGRKKALLMIKITIVIAIFLLITLFSIIIAQTVQINRLRDKIDSQLEYSSQAIEE